MGQRDDMMLIDRIEYYIKHPEDIGWFGTMFSMEERNLLETAREFEKIRCGIQWGQKDYAGSVESSDLTEAVFQKRERERDVSFRLKEQVVHQLDILLAEGRIEAWMEILTWYQFLKGKDFIINKFWEFPVLEVMLDAFMEEWKQHNCDGRPISVLSLRNMKELADAYFTMVFLLRRIEYGIDPIEETLYNLMGRGMSLAVVRTVLAKARIFDKEKVEKAIGRWIGNPYGQE